MAQKMTGKQAVLEMLKAEGVQHIFGNPGTSEGPLMDMLGDYPELEYHLTLQESVAVGMGESYARSIETAACVMLHVDSGLANGICLMLDALNTGTPMVVMSANYDARKVNETMTDLAELVRPVTKWSVELDLADQIPSVIRRAFHEANSHPRGPVYVGFSANALEAEAEMNIVPSNKMHDDTRPSPKGIEEAVALIAAAKNPLMMVGDRVSEDHANDVAVELAELMGFPVYQSRGAEVAFPTMHPQFFGNHTLRTPGGRAILEDKDLVLCIGMDAIDELFYWGDVILGENTKLIHIDPIPGRAGRSEPTDVGIVSHCRMGIEELIAGLKPLVTPELANEIDGRKIGVVAAAADKRKAFEESVTENWDSKPMSPARMMYELAAAMPDNAIVVDDSLSNRATMRHYFQGKKRGDIRAFRGQAIGGGMGATMGVKVAHPDRPVVGILGDGSAMMTVQGLWTAANDNIPCVFVICNNGMYRILKVNFDVYQRDILQMKETAGENLPYSDFPTPFHISAIAGGMGVAGERITDPAEIAPALQRALASGKPAVLDIVIDGAI
ncbi:MAG: thiamine pyrophosphate-binding protein [Dehalococcoidia bacterium]|nr:thiamine pyrophosphate-binding protein [Dehalococcoidia bacterium]